MATMNALKQLADALEVVAQELHKISADPYWTRFAEEQTFSEVKAAEVKAEVKAAAKVSFDELRQRLVTINSDLGKKAEVKELLKSYGAEKLKDVPEDKYDELYDKAKELM